MYSGLGWLCGLSYVCVGLDVLLGEFVYSCGEVWGCYADGYDYAVDSALGTRRSLMHDIHDI